MPVQIWLWALTAATMAFVWSQDCNAALAQKNLEGNWTGTLTTPAGPSAITFTVNSVGNLTGTFAGSQAITGKLTLASATTGQVSGNILFVSGNSNFVAQPNVKIASPGVGGKPFRLTGTFTGSFPSGPVSDQLDVSGGTLSDTPPTVAMPASASPNPVLGTGTALSTLGADNNGEPALIYTWSATGPALVGFSANGTNAAKNSTATFSKSGSYTFTVTIKDANNATVTSSVLVTVTPILAGISVTPLSATVLVGSTKSFSASGVDQFGNAFSLGATSWTVSGGGTISSTGLFSATMVGGPFTVTATSIGKSGAASVTVKPNTPPSIVSGPSANPNPASP